MDGASKFVKGDAIAGIIIIIINFVGGIAIGMLQRGMEMGDALSTYGLLTVGDGLVTQIPALLMAVSTGMIVTRSNAEADMGSTASAQLMQAPNALMIAGVAAVAMALIPGMPPLPFVLVGAALLFGSQRAKKSQRSDAASKESEQAALAHVPVDPNEQLMEEMRIHPVEILLAPDMVDMVSGSADDLLARVRSLRHKIAMDLGIVIPPVRTRDSVELASGTYVIRIAGVEAGRGSAPGGRMLALGDSLSALPGQSMVEPVFGLAGKWIPGELRHSAEMSGATVIDRVSVLVTHLSSVVTANAARLLSREDVRVLTEGVRAISPSAVEELTPGLLSLAELQRVLQGLLEEQVPINDLTRIYEALTLRAKISTDAESLVESARQALGPALAAGHLDGSTLNVIMIDPSLEQSMLEDMRPAEGGTQIVMGQDKLDTVLGSLSEAIAAAAAAGRQPVLVCAPTLRPAVRRLVGPGSIAVLSYREVTSANVRIETIGVVRYAGQLSA
ncbi:FHIPEP family type III secretion protein [Arthrobacter ulcerisalmonis]